MKWWELVRVQPGPLRWLICLALSIAFTGGILLAGLAAFFFFWRGIDGFALS